MQAATVLSYALSTTEEGLTASVQQDPNTSLSFTSHQIKYGVIGNLSHQELLNKIQSLSAEKITAFLYPTKNPTELWLFEAVPMAAAAIWQGKEHLKQAEYKKALQQFKTALKIQKSQKGNLSDLEQAICCIQKKQLIFKCRQKARLYLPNAKELEHFENVLDTYQEQDDLYTCFQTLVAIEDHLLPHHFLMDAIVYEKQERWQEAIEAYLRLADQNSHALHCIRKAYSLLDKDRQSAVRMAFDEALMQLSMASSFSSPTCFICFNESEDDVRKWLESNLLPDLDKVGIRPIMRLRALGIGQDLDDFHELAREADLVIVICTPALKAKYEETKKAPIGLAQELRIIKGRYKHKANTTFPVILKGSPQEAIPSAHFEPTLSASFSLATLNFNYFVKALELFAAMLHIPPAKGHEICRHFVEDVKIILSGAIECKELTDEKEKKKQRVQELFQSIAHRVTQMTRIVHLPALPKDFTGRVAEIERLHALCCQHSRIVINGLGGVGKTALAIKYADIYQSHYTLIKFMPASTPQLLMTSLLELADHLFIPRSENVKERLTWLKNALNRREKPYLLIFDEGDNIQALQEIEHYLPNRGRCLLLTSRLTEACHALGFERMDLEPLVIEEAIAYLLKATGSQDHEEAQRLAEKLGRFPLALSHAASYIRKTRISLQTYNNLFSEKFQLFPFEDKSMELNAEKKTILITWKISMEVINRSCPLAQEVMNFFAFLEQAPIPFSFVKKWFEVLHKKESAPKFIDALGNLLDYSMISSPSFDNYSVHSLVQQVMRYQMSPEIAQHHLLHALQAGFEITDGLDPELPQVRQQLHPFIPHLRAITCQKFGKENLHILLEILEKIWGYDQFNGLYQTAEQTARAMLTISENPEERASCLNYLAMSMQDLGELSDACSYFQQALEIWKKRRGEKDRDVATGLSNLAIISLELGQYRDALKYCQQALKIDKQLLGEKNPDLAINLDNMGTVLSHLGHYQKSLEYHLQALKLRKKQVGEKHPNLAVSLNNVGEVLTHLGRYEEALEYQKQSLEINKENLGKKHPDLARSLDNTGGILAEMGRYEEALDYYSQALALRQEFFGEKHPTIALSLINLGGILSLAEPEKALNYHLQALELRKEFFGKDHPDVATSLSHIGGVLSILSRHEEALQYYFRALKIRKKNLGNKHPDIAASWNEIGTALANSNKPKQALQCYKRALKLNQELLGDRCLPVAKVLSNIGGALSNLNRHKKALKYEMQALRLRKEIVGKKHPDVAASLEHIGCALEALNKREKGLSYHKKARKIFNKLFKFRKESLGENHSDIAANLNNRGEERQDLGDPEGALQCHLQALEKRKAHLGEKHPKVVESLHNVVSVLLDLDNPEEAFAYSRQALELNRELLGEEHPNLVTSLNNMGEIAFDLGKYEEALQCYRQSLELDRKNLGEKHFDVAQNLSNVAKALEQLNRYEEALRYYEQALEIRKEILDESHPAIEESLDNIRSVLRKLGRLKEAGEYRIQSLELNKKRMDEERQFNHASKS